MHENNLFERSKGRLLAIVSLGTLLLLTACQSTSVLVDRKSGHDFSSYGTFALYPLNTGSLVSDPRINSLQLQRLEAACIDQLQQKGLVLSEASAADFYLAVRLIPQKDTELVDFGADRFATRNGLFEDRHPLWLREVEYETMVVDVVDVLSQQVVWRGESVQSLRGLTDSQQAAVVKEVLTPLLAELSRPLASP